MTTNLTRTHRIGLVAVSLTTLAGVVEVVAGSNSWTGDKSEPTTLGIAGPIGILGVAGAVAAITALAIKHRSRSLAAAVLVVGIIPFAAAAWWSVVIPLTAILLLTIELPLLLTNRFAAPTPRRQETDLGASELPALAVDLPRIGD